MTTRIDYTTEEWKMLQNAPYIAGGTVMELSLHGIFKVVRAVKEAFSLYPIIMDTSKQFADNTLVQAVLHTGGEEHSDDSHKEETGQSLKGEAAKAYCLETCRHVATMLEQKSPALEAEGFKQWLLMIADGMHSKATKNELGDALLQEMATALRL